MNEILQDRFFLLIGFALFGAVFGSFATALIYRLPREINWVSKRSICPKCNHVLGPIDLFPILSYIFTGGKCRYCKAQFGANYLYVEVLMMLSFMLSARIYGPDANSIILSMLCFATIIIFAVDFEFYIIPDEVNLLIFILGIWHGIHNHIGLQHLIIRPLGFFALAMGLRYFMYLWKKKEGLGLGDVKFFAAAGPFLSMELLPVFLFVSGMIGVFIAILWKILKKGDIFPFGPALSLSLLLCVAFPEMGQKLIFFMQRINN